MKKSVISMGLALILVMAFTSCKKTEEGKSENAVFRASTVSVTSSDKTYVGQQGLDTIVMWNAGDAIKVFTRTASPFSVEASVLTTDENAKSVVPFYGNVRESDVYYAFYPACNITDLEAGNKIHVTLPETQAYTEGGFAVNTFPMWAFSTEKYFNFRSTCAILGIQLKGNAKVGSIVLSSKSADKPLAGTVEIDAAAFDPTSPSYTFTETEKKQSVTLDCGEQGVQLTKNDTTIFYFVIPANTYQGIEVVVNDLQGNKLGGKETQKTLNMAAETIYYMATFTVNADTPEPGVEGYFTVGLNKKVVFAPGNLYYLPNAEHKWQFAPRHYGVLPYAPQNENGNQNVKRDLFCWGTSGFNNTASDPWATHYQPWDIHGDFDWGLGDHGEGTLGHEVNVHGFGPSHEDSNYPNIDSTDYDWGHYNAIYNPSTNELDTAGTWRVLIGGDDGEGEWHYIFDVRETKTSLGDDVRYAKAGLTGVSDSTIYGVIIFPDDYTHPAGGPEIKGINNPKASFSVNMISSDDWDKMDLAGAVFLPYGIRYNSRLEHPNEPLWLRWLAYWSATHYCENEEAASFMLYASDSELSSAAVLARCNGMHVRLVKDVPKPKYK